MKFFYAMTFLLVGLSAEARVADDPHAGNACQSNRAVTLTDVETRAELSGDSARVLQNELANDAYDLDYESKASYHSYVKFVGWLAEYNQLFLEVAIGESDKEFEKYRKSIERRWKNDFEQSSVSWTQMEQLLEATFYDAYVA